MFNWYAQLKMLSCYEVCTVLLWRVDRDEYWDNLWRSLIAFVISVTHYLNKAMYFASDYFI